MNRSPVKSSHIKSIGHENGILEVEYGNGGIYHLSGVSDDDYTAIMSAKSIGSLLATVSKREDVKSVKIEPEIIELA